MLLRNYITVDNPNIPVLTHNKPEHIEYGKFTETIIEDFGRANGSIVRMKDMYLPNFSLRVFDAQFSENVAFYNTHAHGTELLGSCVFFQAKLKSILPGDKNTVEMYHRTHNFKYDPYNEFLHLALANSPLHFVHFSYTSEYLDQLLPQNEAWADELKKRIERKERLMGSHPLPINLTQEHALQNIFNCPLDGKLGQMMIETSIIQLLLLQLHAIFGQGSELSSAISKKDNGIIHEVKEYITKNFLQDHSMSCLAKHFGVNTNKLMHLYKTTFGKSIFEHLTELRMEYARQLLRDDKFRIVDIARTMGYKNPNHFSTAFKKHYGFSPSELK